MTSPDSADSRDSSAPRDARPSDVWLAGRLLRLAGAALTFALVVRAFVTPDEHWDAWSYHLPFAARIVGEVPVESFQLTPHLEKSFEGYPLLGHAMMGVLWAVTDRPQSTNLVNTLALIGFCLLLRRLFRVPYHASLLALVAVPMVQIHAVGSYLDLAPNLAAAAAVLIVVRMWLREDRRRPRDYAALVVAGALAANMRHQMLFVVTAAMLGALVLAWREHRAREHRPEEGGARAWALPVAIALAALGLVYFSQLENLVTHGNPVYPLKVQVGETVVLEGFQEPHYEGPRSLRDAPEAYRWGRSVLGFGEIDETRPVLWTADMAARNHDGESHRMGGYFGPYVVANLALLVFLVSRRRDQLAWALAATLVGLTLLTMATPAAHELRYFQYWMVLLVSANAILLFADGERRSSVAGVTAAAGVLLYVAFATQWTYLWPDTFDRPFPQFVGSRVHRTVLADIREGDEVCLVGGLNSAFLYAQEFHPDRRHRVRSVMEEWECRGVRLYDLEHPPAPREDREATDEVHPPIYLPMRAESPGDREGFWASHVVDDDVDTLWRPPPERGGGVAIHLAEPRPVGLVRVWNGPRGGPQTEQLRVRTWHGEQVVDETVVDFRRGAGAPLRSVRLSGRPIDGLWLAPLSWGDEGPSLAEAMIYQ